MNKTSELKNLALLYSIRVLTLDYLAIRRELKKWIPNDNLKVLDLGCGVGYFSSSFHKKGYLGIDIDYDSIALAKKLHPKYNFLVADMSKFKPKDKFDLVFIVGVLHHLTNMQMNKSLEIMKKITKKNSQTIIIEAIPPISKYNLLGKFFRKLDQGHHIRTLENYKKSIQKKFNITYSKKIYGGIFDYAIFIATN